MFKFSLNNTGNNNKLIIKNFMKIKLAKSEIVHLLVSGALG